MLWRNCVKCDRVTKHDINTRECMEDSRDKLQQILSTFEEQIDNALTQYKERTREGATW